MIELLLKFRADPSAQNNDRQHLLEAVLQNRTSAVELLLRFGASACGVQLSKHLKSLEKLSRADLLNQLPSFTWWGQDLPVEQLLKIRYSDLKTQLSESSEDRGALGKRLRIQVLEALMMLIPLLTENETLEVLAGCVLFLQHLQCHPEASHLAAKQPASLLAFKDFHMTTEFTEARVRSVAFCEKFLATASADNKVRIYDLEDFGLVKELGEATDTVRSVAFSEKFLASGSADKKVRIYDLDHSPCEKELVQTDLQVNDSAKSLLGILAAPVQSRSKHYDAEQFLRKFTIELAEATEQLPPIFSVALSENFLASGSRDNKVRIYDLEDFCLVKELGEATNTVFSVAFSEKILASGSDDKKVRIYDLEDFGLVKELGEATGDVRTVAFSKKFLASGSRGGNVWIRFRKFQDLLAILDCGS